MGRCMRCGRDSEMTPWVFGVCGSCEEQERQTKLLEEQNQILQDEAYKADQARREHTSRVQSRCRHEYEAAANFLGRWQTPEESRSCSSGRLVWRGKCRQCGALMSDRDMQNCRHEFGPDYYFGTPRAQCLRCGLLDPSVKRRVLEAEEQIEGQCEDDAKRKRLKDEANISYVVLPVCIVVILFLCKGWGSSDESQRTGRLLLMAMVGLGAMVALWEILEHLAFSAKRSAPKPPKFRAAPSKTPASSQQTPVQTTPMVGDIYFKCQECGKHLSIDGRGVGRTIRCPDCGSEGVVPSPAYSVSCPSCRARLLVAEGLVGESGTCSSCKSKVQFSKSALDEIG